MRAVAAEEVGSLVAVALVAVIVVSVGRWVLYIVLVQVLEPVLVQLLDLQCFGPIGDRTPRQPTVQCFSPAAPTLFLAPAGSPCAMGQDFQPHGT